MTKQEVLNIMRKRNSPEDRFMLRAMAIQQSHGGRPTARLGADGRIEFVYPDGSVTK